MGMAEVERIAAQPFARFEPDERYMEELRDRQDWNDPMRDFQEENDSKPDERKMQKKPKCPHVPWPNRFDILPRFRWDGKIRGNGYERRWLEARNNREFQKLDKMRHDLEGE